MIGQNTVPHGRTAQHLFRKVWGTANIHARQKWQILWPHIRRLRTESLSILDAGCGAGDWSLELAARRPEWTVHGIDYDSEAVEMANRRCADMNIPNVTFSLANFASFYPEEKFDVVLSVNSAHYMAEAGLGETLFRAFRSWLKPEGELLLLGPRQFYQSSKLPFLPEPMPPHSVFDESQLRHLCRSADLHIECLEGRVGLFGATAKQLTEAMATQVIPWKVCTYAGAYVLDFADRVFVKNADQSLYWLLTCRAGRGVSSVEC